jgi:hypothetical protein
MWALVILYLVAMVGWTYGLLVPSPSEALIWASVAVVTAAHVALGYFIGLWTPLLFAVAIVLAMPAGAPDVGGEPLPIWADLVLFAPIVLVATLVGMVVRFLRDRRRAA